MEISYAIFLSINSSLNLIILYHYRISGGIMNNIVNYKSIRRIRGGCHMTDISKERKMEIEQIVSDILKPYQISILSPTIDIVSIVKMDGFLVQSADLPIETTGYLAVNDKEPVDDNNEFYRLIVVNNKFRNPDNEDNVVLKKSRFITAHEYGHFKLHKAPDESLYAHRDRDKRDSLQELEADYFARSILMPKDDFLLRNTVIDSAFKNILSRDGHLHKGAAEMAKLELLSRYYKVTRNKVSKRLEDIDILSSMEELNDER